MIIFVTSQFAGAQYLHPLLREWDTSPEKCPEYKVVATGSSIHYWRANEIKYDEILEKTAAAVVKYLKMGKTTLVVLSASGSEELEYIFILQAKKLGIETANFIDNWTNYKGRYTYNGKSVYPNTILSINEKCTEEMIEDGIPAEIIQDIGQPYLEEVCNAIPALGSQILMPLQPIKKAWGNQLGYDETSFLNTVIPVIEQAGKTSQLNITNHPDSDPALYKGNSIKLEQGKGIDDIKNSHTVLGMFSMQMVIGYLWGRKVASIQPNLKGADPSPLSRWGLIPRIDNTEELFKFINLKPINTITQRLMLLKQIDGSLKRLDIFLRRK